MANTKQTGRKKPEGTAKQQQGRTTLLHWSIRKRLGYPLDMPDREVLKDWKQRLGRVCKPCWELKYCPYGPLVEQSPLLPSPRQDVVEHNQYLQQCIDTGLLGQTRQLDDDTRAIYEKWLRDDDVLLRQVLHELDDHRRVETASKSTNPISDFVGRPLPSIEVYRVSYELKKKPIKLADIPKSMRGIVRSKLSERRRKLRATLKSGIDDLRRPLDPVRRAWFEKEIREFKPNNYPEHIPSTFAEGACNIFGHICPVFFSAEAITETSTYRRRGRYIPFKVKVRVVRRDNYTCQHCGAHLRDDEVEFDHKIPISRGGSSEEHNIRLTCFECNRDKKDDVEI